MTMLSSTSAVDCSRTARIVDRRYAEPLPWSGRPVCTSRPSSELWESNRATRPEVDREAWQRARTPHLHPTEVVDGHGGTVDARLDTAGAGESCATNAVRDLGRRSPERIREVAHGRAQLTLEPGP